MQITYATARGDGAVNEDYVACGPEWAIVLDGATTFPGTETGCVHDVPWLVRQLAAGITRGLMLSGASLPDVLANAISLTCKAHAGTCDLSNPDSPSSTVAIVRLTGDSAEYLVLGDSPVILARGAEIVPVVDDRLDHLPGGRPYSRALVRQMRNAPGGFWVASTSEQAAYEALTGTRGEVTELVMLTDGVTRLADFYRMSWARLFEVLREEGGPTGLIQRVRHAEQAAPAPHGKRHDDATAVYARWVGRPADEPLVPDPLILTR